jgi:hypothetical protein
MFASVVKGPEENLMSGAHPHVLDSIKLDSVVHSKGIDAFLSFEYSPRTGHNNAVNYWRASEIVGQAREKNPDRSELVVVGTDNSIYYLQGDRNFSDALIQAGNLLKEGGIPAPITLDRVGRDDDPDHNIALIADYYPESHAIVLRENTMNLSSSVNREDLPRISKSFHELQSQCNKIMVVAEVRANPGKQQLDEKTLEGFLYNLDRSEITHQFLFHVDAMLNTFYLSSNQAKELFEVSAARALESASYARTSETPYIAADQSASAFEIAVMALKAVSNPHEIPDLISNAYEAGGKVTGHLAQAGVIESAHSVVSAMERIPLV